MSSNTYSNHRISNSKNDQIQKNKKQGGNKQYSEKENSNNISSGSSNMSIAIEIKIIKKHESYTGTGTKYKESTITTIKQIRSLPIQNKNNIANNEPFVDLSDSTSESINTSNKKLGICHIKTKVTNLNNNHRNERNNKMIQNRNYTGKNYKSRKDQYFKIQRNNKNQKYYNYSNTRSEGTISNIPKINPSTPIINSKTINMSR